MPEPCAAVLTTGEPCPAPGSVPDATGRLVCYEHAGSEIVPHAIRKAMAAPDRCYLAAALAEETDASLAALLGCAPSRVWRLRLMGWPRAAQWEADVVEMAASIGGDPELLGALLERLSAWQLERQGAQGCRSRVKPARAPA
jgi:hypothetical protein